MKILRGNNASIKIPILIVLLCTLASAQFDHIVVIFQENQTPDHLFCAAQISGADVICSPIGVGNGMPGAPNVAHSHTEYELQVSGGKIPKGAYNHINSGANPYWQIAQTYGFANRMFQTVQGDSYPAHLVIVGGNPNIADDSTTMVEDMPIMGSVGCNAKPDSIVPTITPNGTTGTIFPCFNRSSLMTLLDPAAVSWKYYAVSGEALWDAPHSFTAYAKSGNVVLNPPQILTDIADGKLANVVWVTPSNAYSDHPGGGTGGPAWVASIVNAIGESSYWQNTAILITWDDWGGWYDHVPPMANNQGEAGRSFIGCYRVPLLVVSAQTPPMVDSTQHDFGSILHFIEANFGLGFIGPQTWADANADDLSVFFTGGEARRDFVKIDARPLTKKELADNSAPDED